MQSTQSTIEPADQTQSWFTWINRLSNLYRSNNKVADTAEEKFSHFHEKEHVNKNFTASSIDSSWKKMSTEVPLGITASSKGIVQSFYTKFISPIKPIYSRSIKFLNVHIAPASFYGAKEWNCATWFITFLNQEAGLLSIDETPEGISKFYPMMSSDKIFAFVPSHSFSGPNSYICIEEGQSFSLWDISCGRAEKIFSQGGFASLWFIGNKLVYGYRNDSNSLECWNTQTKKLEYEIKNPYNIDNDSIRFKIFNKFNNILLSSSNNKILAWDLTDRHISYELELNDNSKDRYNIELINETLCYARQNNQSEIQVFDILKGTKVCTFKIGGGSNSCDSDNYPLATTYTAIFALKEDDKKCLCKYNPLTGNIDLLYEALDLEINQIICSEDRIIGHCYSLANNLPWGNDLIAIWDMNTGKILKIITHNGFYMNIEEVRDNKMTIFTEKVTDGFSQKKPTKKFLQTKDNHSFHKELPVNDKHWTAEFFMIINSGVMTLDIWDLNNCELFGTIQEEFIDKTEDGIYARLVNGRLVADNGDTVIIQQYDY